MKEEGPFACHLAFPRASFKFLRQASSSVVDEVCGMVSTIKNFGAAAVEGSVLLLFILHLDQVLVLSLTLALGYAVGLCLLLGSFVVVTGISAVVVRFEDTSFRVVGGFPLQMLVFQVKPRYTTGT